jgi:hypothetical protein
VEGRQHTVEIEQTEAVDDELLLMQMYSSDDDAEGAEAALTQLYARHAGFLEAVCEKYGWRHVTRPARDFVNEAFAIAFRDRPAFAPPLEATAESRRRAVRNFLCGICRLRFLKFYERMRREPLTEALPLEAGWSEAERTEDVTLDGLEGEEMRPTPPARAAIRRYFDSLEEANRLILTFSAPYIDLKTGRCQVPPREARALAEMVGLELPAIRQRRKRMLGQIRNLLAEIADERMRAS